MPKPSAVLLILVASALPGMAANLVAPDDDVLVAVIDTGVEGAHPEFGGYLGQPGVGDPQIVGWWDFAADGNPQPGERWDPAHAVPRDSTGHGTGTASLVAGRTLGRCPGVKLAIAKVADEGGRLTGDIAEAMRWAVATMHADVLSMSFGTIVPEAAMLDAMDERAEEAHRAGALLVASAGNGLGNLGVKYAAELQAPADSPFVLAVGATTQSGGATGTVVASSYANLDPEVVAWGTSVPMASPGGGSTVSTGTSFSAPKVAGYGACLMRAGLRHGQDASPGRVEQLLKWTARDDPLVPYQLEGYGLVHDATYQQALAYAEQGGLPNGPSGLLNPAQDLASQEAKVAWTEAEPALVAADLPGPRAGSVGGPSSFFGAQQSEVWRVHARAGDVLRVRLAYDQPAGAPALQDLDLFLLRPGADADGLLSRNEVLAEAATGPRAGTSVEELAYPATAEGEFALLVFGYLGTEDQPFTLEASAGGAPVEVSFARDVATAGLLETP